MIVVLSRSSILPGKKDIFVLIEILDEMMQNLMFLLG